MAVRFASKKALSAATAVVAIPAIAALAPAWAAMARSAAPPGWRIVKTVKVASLRLADVVP